MNNNYLVVLIGLANILSSHFSLTFSTNKQWSVRRSHAAHLLLLTLQLTHDSYGLYYLGSQWTRTTSAARNIWVCETNQVAKRKHINRYILPLVINKPTFSYCVLCPQHNERTKHQTLLRTIKQMQKYFYRRSLLQGFNKCFLGFIPLISEWLV